jgi:hypothetical protein
VMIESGRHQSGCPPGYGSPAMIYSRFARCCQVRHMKAIIPRALGRGQFGEAQLIDPSRTKTHCLAQAVKGEAWAKRFRRRRVTVHRQSVSFCTPVSRNSCLAAGLGVHALDHRTCGSRFRLFIAKSNSRIHILVTALVSSPNSLPTDLQKR